MESLQKEFYIIARMHLLMENSMEAIAAIKIGLKMAVLVEQL